MSKEYVWSSLDVHSLEVDMATVDTPKVGKYWDPGKMKVKCPPQLSVECLIVLFWEAVETLGSRI
jgi:hypothetical protein